MPTRRASAVWKGGLKAGGSGSFEGESGVVSAPYTLGGRFGDDPGTNPEELLAAAEAACFSMALSGNLERNGTTPKEVETKAACTIEKEGDGFRITTMKLSVRADVPGIDEETFQSIAEKTRDGCPVSGAIKGNVEIVLDASLA